MEEQHRAERLGLEERADHAFGGVEQMAEEHALVARICVEEVNQLLDDLQGVAINGVEVNEEAGQARRQVA
eukprot:9047722-Lingulodinium_polyedra.AAC.1